MISVLLTSTHFCNNPKSLSNFWNSNKTHTIGQPLPKEGSTQTHGTIYNIKIMCLLCLEFENGVKKAFTYSTSPPGLTLYTVTSKRMLWYGSQN